MTEFDKTTELKLKLDPLIASARADLAQLHALSSAHGDELWNSSPEAGDVGRALARAIRRHEVDLEDATEMIAQGYVDTVAFRKSAVELMRALEKIEASDFAQKIERVKPVAPKPRPKEIVIRLDKQYYANLEKEKKAMEEETKTGAEPLTPEQIEELEREKESLLRGLRAREPRRDAIVPTALDVKPSVPRPGLERPDPASVILAEKKLAEAEDAIRRGDKEFRESLDASKQAGIVRRQLLVAKRGGLAEVARSAREAYDAESLAESLVRREADSAEAARLTQLSNEQHLEEVRERIRPLYERGREAQAEMVALYAQHGETLKRIGELSWTAIPGSNVAWEPRLR